MLEYLLPRSPLSMQLREKITELIAQVDGDEAAIAHWRSAAEEFPYYQPLVERYAMALRGRPLQEVQPVLEKILEQTPENAWAVRELAQHLLSAGKLDDAERMIARAVELDGENSFAVGLQATLDSRRGNNAAARDRLRKLLENDISDEYIVSKFLDSCDSVEEQKAELAWVLSELRRQPVTGEVLMIFRDYAQSVVPADELLESLREAVRGATRSLAGAPGVDSPADADAETGRGDRSCQPRDRASSRWNPTHGSSVTASLRPSATRLRSGPRCSDANCCDPRIRPSSEHFRMCCATKEVSGRLASCWSNLSRSSHSIRSTAATWPMCSRNWTKPRRRWINTSKRSVSSPSTTTPGDGSTRWLINWNAPIIDWRLPSESPRKNRMSQAHGSSIHVHSVRENSSAKLTRRWIAPKRSTPTEKPFTLGERDFS